jgi:hypothetical protein
MAFQSTFFRDSYDLAFQVSPIILTGGIASGIPGGMLPIIMLAGGLTGFAQGLLSGGGLSMQDFPARFIPTPGTTAILQSIGQYPFANRQIAANATIEMPKNIGFQMIAPVQDFGGYLTKLALFTSLQSALNSHNNNGGTYTLATPSMLFPDCVMLGMTDVTQTSSKQQQIMWQMDFQQPLISEQSAQAAFNGLMGLINSGSQVASGSWSGIGSMVGSAIGSATTVLNNGIAGAIGSVL